MATISAVADSNIFLRHLLGDIPDQSTRANDLFAGVMRGETHIYAPSTVFFEVAYVLTKVKGVRAEPAAKALSAMLDFPGLHTDHRAALLEAFEFWSQQGPLSFADCFHLSLARHLDVTQIYTFDRKMDRYPGITRIEP